MSREESNRLKYTIALIAEFANRFGIGEKQAYNYLSRFKGLSHLVDFTMCCIHNLSTMQWTLWYKYADIMEED